MKFSIKCTALVFLFLIAAASVVVGQSDARSIWKNAVKKCAASDQDGPIRFGGKHVFFGIGNVSGPGAIFRVFPDGGLTSSRPVSSYIPADRSNLIEVHREFSCAGTNNRSVKISPRVGIDAVIPIGGDLSVESKRARKISFTVKNLRWENLYVGNYEQFLKTSATATDVRQDLELIAPGSRDFVLTRVLRVDGFAVELEFDNATGVAVKAKFPPQALSIPIVGEANVGADLQWTGDTKLTIVSDGSFYIAGDLRRVVNGRLTTKLKKSEIYGLSIEQLTARFFRANQPIQGRRQ